MISRHSKILVAALALTACGQEEQILLPDNIDVHWDASFNGLDDHLGAVVPVDVMAYDAASGEPLVGVELELTVDHANTYLLKSSDASPVVAACSDCDVLWDAYRDEYYEMQTELTEEQANIRLETDEDGVAHFYVVVDAFAVSNDSFLSVRVQAATDLVQGAFYLQPR